MAASRKWPRLLPVLQYRQGGLGSLSSPGSIGCGGLPAAFHEWPACRYSMVNSRTGGGVPDTLARSAQ
eukprot:1422649-Prymnesium_polylepis.1